MPIKGPWSRLTPANVQAVPSVPGVYEVGTLVRNTLFIERSANRNLRTCLNGELTAPRSEIRQRTALYFRYEQTGRDDQRHRELLEEYRRSHGGNLPPLNQPSDLERAPVTGSRLAHIAGHGQLRAVS